MVPAAQKEAAHGGGGAHREEGARLEVCCWSLIACLNQSERRSLCCEGRSFRDGGRGVSMCFRSLRARVSARLGSRSQTLRKRLTTSASNLPGSKRPSFSSARNEWETGLSSSDMAFAQSEQAELLARNDRESPCERDQKETSVLLFFSRSVSRSVVARGGGGGGGGGGEGGLSLSLSLSPREKSFEIFLARARFTKDPLALAWPRLLDAGTRGGGGGSGGAGGDDVVARGWPDSVGVAPGGLVVASCVFEGPVVRSKKFRTSRGIVGGRNDPAALDSKPGKSSF